MFRTAFTFLFKVAVATAITAVLAVPYSYAQFGRDRPAARLAAGTIGELPPDEAVLCGGEEPGTEVADQGGVLPDKVADGSTARDRLQQPPDVHADSDSKKTVGQASGNGGNGDRFRWNEALRQSLLFLLVEHGFRLATESDTRAELKGPFFRDYLNTVKSLRGWRDGDIFTTNYIGHPLQGAISGFIQIHNDPKAGVQEIRRDRDYWRSRLKAMGFSALYSVQFELGPLSEATIGNVGLKPRKRSPHPMAAVDLVVTPLAGTALLVGEDFVDRYLIRRIESNTNNRAVTILARSLLNPSRSFANLLRGKWFWYRDDR